MKKFTLLFLILVFGFAMWGCQNTTDSTITTAPIPPTISEMVNASDNPYNIGLFMTATPEASMGINFELSTDTTAIVKYRLKGTDTFTTIEATKKTTAVGRKTVYLYEAEMTGLSLNENYEYQVSSSDATIVSEQYEFSMASDPASSYSFMYLADPQDNTEMGYMAYAFGILSVLDYSQTDFDFVMSPGDFVDDADIRSEWNWFYQYSSSFLTSKPLMATIGNHEASGITEERINRLEFDGYLNLPHNGPTYEAFDELEGDVRNANFDDGKTYSFNYGNTHFVAINTEVFCDGTTTCGTYDHSNAEILKTWLTNDLEANDSLWTIVLLHRGPYGLSYDTTSVRDNLTPIFDQYNVDLVLSGHDHQYSRTVYNASVMVPFQTSNDYIKGTITLTESGVLNQNFNNYSSSIGVTYFTGNTATTKFYGGSKSSGVIVTYKFIDENPVIPMITVTNDSIHVVSYGVEKEMAISIVPSGVYVLEEFTITK